MYTVLRVVRAIVGFLAAIACVHFLLVLLSALSTVPQNVALELIPNFFYHHIARMPSSTLHLGC